jgi:hypothetical protein
MNYKALLILISFLSLMGTKALAQDSAIERTFHESGKINVVIFIGLIYYFVRLEKKISKIEKDIKN